MALTIGTNVASLQASAAASSVNRDLETSMARLSTGKRINSAADDAAGVAIASRLSSEIRGTDQAIRNALDGQALIDTAEGGHKEIEAILQRMREISVQAANDTNSAQDRGNLQAEMSALTTEIDRIAGVTTWAGNSVMDGGGSTSKTFSLQVGAATGTKNQISVAINSMSTASLGLTASPFTFIEVPNSGTGNSDVDGLATGLEGALDANGLFTMLTGAGKNQAPAIRLDQQTITARTATSLNGTPSAAPTNFDVVAAELIELVNNDAAFQALGVFAKADAFDGNRSVQLSTKEPMSVFVASHARYAVKAIDAAIKTVNTQRSELGAISNRLSHTVSNMTNISTNLSAARGGIEDADFALETTNLAKNQILQQASTAMLAQANASKQNVLSLLQ
jgi:flagellin